MGATMNMADVELPTAASLPSPLGAAIERVALAESELARVYPLFATKLDGAGASPTGARAAFELAAFVADVRLSHHAAIHALRSWRVREEPLSAAAAEAAAAAYESLAVLIERFAMNAGLDACELDSGSMPVVADRAAFSP